MPSPFSGTDPFIEDSEWEDFHTTFSVVISEMLMARIRPRYVVRIKGREYLESPKVDDELHQAKVRVEVSDSFGGVTRLYQRPGRMRAADAF